MSEYLNKFYYYLICLELGHVRVVRTFRHEKEDNIMTQTQVNYGNMILQKDQLAETKRQNQRMYELNMAELLENQRAHRASEANAVYAADQRRAGDEAKAEATNAATRSKERTARMEVTASNKQKEADRQQKAVLTQQELDTKQKIADMEKETRDRANDIAADLNRIREDNNIANQQINRDKLAQLGDELAFKYEQLAQQADQFKKQLGFDKRRFAHTVIKDTIQNTNDSIAVATKAAKDIADVVFGIRAGGDASQGAQTLTQILRNMRRSR